MPGPCQLTHRDRAIGLQNCSVDVHAWALGLCKGRSPWAQAAGSAGTSTLPQTRVSWHGAVTGVLLQCKYTLRVHGIGSGYALLIQVGSFTILWQWRPFSALCFSLVISSPPFLLVLRGWVFFVLFVSTKWFLFYSNRKRLLLGRTEEAPASCFCFLPSETQYMTPVK